MQGVESYVVSEKHAGKVIVHGCVFNNAESEAHVSKHDEVLEVPYDDPSVGANAATAPHDPESVKVKKVLKHFYVDHKQGVVLPNIASLYALRQGIIGGKDRSILYCE